MGQGRRWSTAAVASVALTALLGTLLWSTTSLLEATAHRRPRQTAVGGAAARHVADPQFGRELLQDDDDGLDDEGEEERINALVKKQSRKQPPPPPPDPRLNLPATAAEHCQLTRGAWCGGYYRQVPVQRYAPPRGNKDCPNNCSGVGNCQYDTGRCYCPAGYGGPDCSQPRKRPCWRMGPDRRDMANFTDWSHSRCAGLCDDDLAMCYCPPETKHGRVEAPAGSAPGTPPIRPGRPLFMCQPDADAAGNKVPWGNVPYDDLYGPNGWCNADVPKYYCPCRVDGRLGVACNIPSEQFCINQCSGHGECINQGFCKCHDGWYGNDCSRKRAGLPYDDGDEVAARPWLGQVITPVVAAEDPPLTPARRRPYIYVYDLDPQFQTDMLQYRIESSHCVYRQWENKNQSVWVGYYPYGSEGVLNELFLASEHRTFDPEEADFFYVPVWSNCLYELYGWNPIPRWPANMHGPRPYGAANMQLAAARWLNATFPYFARRGGRDHIWLSAHDEGACSVFKDIWPGIMLSHWGRMDFPHISGTSYANDNYSVPMDNAFHNGQWLDHTSRAHPCFDPRKDLVIPSFKHPKLYRWSPYLGAPEPERRGMKTFFRGDTGLKKWDPDGQCMYSRCTRQRLYNMSVAHGWREMYGFYYGGREELPGDFSQQLTNATFCLALIGEGWGHPEDGTLQGCIPVIVADDVQMPFESILDYSKFAVRVAQHDLERLPEILDALSPETVASLRAGVDKVWHRFRYNGLTKVQASTRRMMRDHKETNGGLVRQIPGVQYADNAVDDAFSTLMQWLYSRIPDVHGAGAKMPEEVTEEEEERAAAAAAAVAAAGAAAAAAAAAR